MPWFKKNSAAYSSRKSSVKTKGLSNQPGQNNCFLNSAVQVLWHLDVFRKNFSLFTGHNCEGQSCIFCAVKKLFARFKYSSDSILPPTELRVALADTYHEQNKFQLGLMDDAAECFENLLLRIHTHIVEGSAGEEMCTAKHCISHQKFGMTLIEQGVCSCGETSEPLPFTQLIHYVSAAALCNKFQNWRSRQYHEKHPNFGKLVNCAARSGGRRKCPSNCGDQIETMTTIMNSPDVISIGVIWDSGSPNLDLIAGLLSSLSPTIKLQDMFRVVLDKTAQKNDYHLCGMVCYYGKHYSTFLFNRKAKRWLSIDDATVTEVGKSYEDVLQKCFKGHYQPLLLIFANWEAKPLELESAPVSIRMNPPSAKTSPCPSRKDDFEVASSCSSGSPSPSRRFTPPTKPKMFQWNSATPTLHVGHYVEPKETKFTTYKPYAPPRQNGSLKVGASKDANDNRRNKQTL